MNEGFDFNEVINRREVPALKVHHMVLGADGMDLFAAGVPDMDFRAPPVVLDAMARRAAHSVVVVSDEIHGDITFAGHPYTPFASISYEDAQNSITCLSPAKSFNIAACCSAFTVVPDQARRDAFKAENSRLTFNKNNAFASVAMQAAYLKGGAWLDAVTAYIEANLALVRERITDVPEVMLIEPEGTFLLWLDFRTLGLEPEKLTEFLRREAGWAITLGIAFGEGGSGFGRLNVACSYAQLDRALDDLIDAISRNRGTLT